MLVSKLNLKEGDVVTCVKAYDLGGWAFFGAGTVKSLGGSLYLKSIPQDAWYELDGEWEVERKDSPPKASNSEGGPSTYYDLQPDWTTKNDEIEYRSINQWKEHSFHLGNIEKATTRWGNKGGTTKAYDARKIIYSGLRVLMMLEGKSKMREYLLELLNNPQFKD